MTRLVVRDGLAILVAHHALAFETRHQTFDRRFKFLRSTSVLSQAASSAASLTRLARSAPAKPRRAGSHHLDIDIRRDLHALM